jgi:hypothetical protein
MDGHSYRTDWRQIDQTQSCVYILQNEASGGSGRLSEIIRPSIEQMEWNIWNQHRICIHLLFIIQLNRRLGLID